MSEQDINPSTIRAGKPLRPLVPARVDSLARNMAEVGLLQPIGVRFVRPEGGQPHLVFGNHRLQAALKLEWEAIRCVVLDVDDIDAEIMAIDENLQREGLSPAQRAAQAARRYELHVAKHPETTRGGDRRSKEARSKRQVDALKDGEIPKAYTKQTARCTGRAERTVHREVQRGQQLGATLLEKVAGTSIDNGRELDAMVKLDEAGRQKVVESIAAGRPVKPTTLVKQQIRQNRAKVLAEKHAQQAVPGSPKRYGVILADPPWEFSVYSEAGKDRAAENHYPVMTDDAILDGLARQIDAAAHDDAVLVLWSTRAKLAVALDLIKRAGFTYRSEGAWRKVSQGGKLKLGTGYWFIDAHEPFLVATRGDVVSPAPGTQLPSVVDAVRGRHSAKPPFVHEWVERCWPDESKLEMFARAGRKGWDATGYEAPALSDGDYAGLANETGATPEQRSAILTALLDQRPTSNEAACAIADAVLERGTEPLQ